MEWTGAKPPKKIAFTFETFTLNHPVEAKAEGSFNSESPTR
jgi:hypothetical protein